MEHCSATCLNWKLLFCWWYHSRTKDQFRYAASQWGMSLHSYIVTSSMLQYQNKLHSCLGISCFVCDVSMSIYMKLLSCRDYSVYAPSQWEMALHCNIISHWLSTYIKWSLSCNMMKDISPCLVSRGRGAVRLRWKALPIHSIIKTDQFQMNSKWKRQQIYVQSWSVDKNTPQG